ncbi:PQQ-binding-like beta-propeller repeat protein [Actinoplanes rectilineatus]|uniref:outer membrane protein assembly factor BamB family protein n=1 Tax=Actinoplanes rectilineatus TaxID=113571 RepID=UPI0005F2FD22|nr:PQQ-binding-like beta-propeller repeat protein [Actinoplanes rectilineatus]
MLIDLDVQRPPSPQPRPRVPWRPVSLLLAVALTLLSGASAARPWTPELHRVAVTDDLVESWLLTEDVLYLADKQEGATALELSAVSLTGGGVLWSRLVEAEFPTLTVAGPNLAVLSEGSTPLVVDAATGAVRWEYQGFGTAVPAGDGFLLSDEENLEFFDPATTRVLWSVPLPDPVVAAATDDHHLVTLDRNNDVWAYDRDTGAVLASNAAVIGDRLTIQDGGVFVLSDLELIALTLPDLRRRWITAMPTPLALTGCGTLLCVGGASGLIGVDPATGEINWRRAEWTAWIDGVAAGGDDDGLVRLDPETGEVAETLGRGFVVGDVFLRPGQGRSWVTRDGAVLGTIPQVLPFGCARAGRHLACQVDDYRVTVWRLAS